MMGGSFYGVPSLVLAVLVGAYAIIVYLNANKVSLRQRPLFSGLTISVLSLAGAFSVLNFIDLNPSTSAQHMPLYMWVYTLVFWASAWFAVQKLSEFSSLSIWANRSVNLLIPVLFGIWLLLLWEITVRANNVSTIILPPPSMIAERFANSTATLWADFKQTFLKAVLIGYALGCGSAFITAILIDRSPFLKRGLLPLGNFVAALPVIGVAPIMVMWYGFDWPSKAAVVIIMTFFPMLVNTVAGLNAAGHMERDLMRTYASGYWSTLFKLRLPAAAPFIFNALKINSTLALIGGIVAEFFGTPIVGMGFRISTEVGRLNVDMVWAEIAVAAVAGSTFYGLIALIERAVTFWHPSIRAE